MKQILLLAGVALLMMGCSHREYVNVQPKKHRNLDIDKERCTYKAESSVPYTAPLVHIEINSHMSKEERAKQLSRKRQQEQQDKWDRDQRVRQLRDLCLKARGWRWKYVDN